MERRRGCGAQASTEGESSSDHTDSPREEWAHIGDDNSNNRSNDDGVATDERQESRCTVNGGELASIV
jgi:hypothetical protein